MTILRAQATFGMLAALASCVAPSGPARPDRPGVAAIGDPRVLLRRLALDAGAGERATATQPPSLSPIAPAPAFVATARTSHDADSALDCLTAAVYHEARSEPVEGQRAVAQVVLNRVRDRAFPASVCGVVYQGSERSTGCQFSFTCDGSLARPRDPAAWERAGMIAAAALAGSVYAPVGSATFYHTDAILPWWAPSLSRVANVGAHIFYRWRSGMARALSFRQLYAGIEPTIAATADTAVAANAPAATGGVTVHRGDAPKIEEAAAGASAADVRPRRVMVAGVTIHRGDAAPMIASDPI